MKERENMKRECVSSLRPEKGREKSHCVQEKREREKEGGREGGREQIVASNVAGKIFRIKVSDKKEAATVSKKLTK